MRIRKCVVFLVLIMYLSSCSSYRHNDRFFAPDKLYHFAVAGSIGAGTTVAAESNGASHNSPIIGVSVSVGVGAGKEFYDLTIKDTYWSWKDMFWNLAGGIAGSYAVKN
ncbi:MAG: hypothetical protein HOC71_05160 [Candidatus Latescibacteria bacterium]|jgi:putative lipoprotein|nr:hypothetical protein [Candidatus Latescibacterota bacterium]